MGEGWSLDNVVDGPRVETGQVPGLWNGGEGTCARPVKEEKELGGDE